MSDETPISMGTLQEQIDGLIRDNAMLSAQLNALNQLVAQLLSAEALATGLWNDWPGAVASSIEKIHSGQVLGRVDLGMEPNNTIDTAVSDFLGAFLQTATDVQEGSGQ